LAGGAIIPICMLIENNDPNSTFVRNCVWCLANLVRGKPLPPYNDMMAMIPVLSKVLKET